MKLKNTIKKVAVAALLATPVASSAISSNTVSAAAVHVSYPGLTDDSENASSWDMYDGHVGTSWRNFKGRTANIYVKDKSLLPATKKAIKFWSPVFKFKLVKSAKHASFHSKKYANVVIYDENVENAPTALGLTATRVYENKNNKKVLKLINKWYPFLATRYTAYANSHITDKNIPWIKKHPGTAGVDFRPKDALQKAFTNHLNMVVNTKNASQQAITNKIISALGSTIGLGDIDTDNQDNNPNPIDIMSVNADNYSEMSVFNKTYHLTQADRDHIDWIYSHPYTGEVNIANSSEVHSL